MTQANKELRKQYGKIDVGKIEVRPIHSGGRDMSSSLSPLLTGRCRTCNTTWRSFWSRQMRFKSR
jgi:hypothetical protein